MLFFRLVFAAWLAALPVAMPLARGQGEFGSATADGRPAPVPPPEETGNLPEEKPENSTVEPPRGPFALPAEGPLPFRRHELPLETSVISELAAHVGKLAQSISVATPKGRRERARALAVSRALDPENQETAAHLEALVNGQPLPAADEFEVARAISGITALNVWLAAPAAGPDGNRLAECLRDVIAFSDPEKSAGKKESALWKNWLPEISHYREKKPESENPPEIKEQAVPAARPKVARAQLEILVWKRARRKSAEAWSLASAPFKMSAKSDDRFSVSIGNEKTARLFGADAREISAALEAAGVPREKLQIRLEITGVSDRELDARRPTPGAAGYVLARAALAGDAPADVSVIGGISAGKYSAPTAVWRHVRALENSPGGRAIFPRSAEPFLTAMLAMENPDYFLKNEILTAGDLEHAAALAAGKPPPEIAGVFTRFQEIRERQTGDLRTYISNRFVRQRLAEIAREAPWHFSAKSLLVQAAGSRPTVLPRAAIAAEAADAVTALGWIDDDWDYDELDSAIGKIDRSSDALRVALDALERLTSREDRPLIESARSLVTGLRVLQKSVRTRAGGHDFWENGDSVSDAREAFLRQYKETSGQLNAAAAEDHGTENH